MEMDLMEAESRIALSPNKSPVPVSLVRSIPSLQEPSTSAVQTFEGLGASEAAIESPFRIIEVLIRVCREQSLLRLVP